MRQRIYIELDCLLDTRLAVLAELVTDPGQAGQLVSPTYLDREIDDFQHLCGVSRDVFRDAYVKRNIQHLQNARPTGVVPLLQHIVTTLEKSAIYAPYTEGVELVVNAHPYRLSEVEQDTLIDCIMAFAGVDCRVQVTYLLPEDLTVDLIDQEYAALFMYDFDQWLSLHGAVLMGHRIPAVTVVCPALYRERVPTTAEWVVEDKDVRSPFAAVELSLIDCLDVRFQDARHFSLLLPSHTA